MKRAKWSASDYAGNAVEMAKALLGAVLCRRLDDGTVLRARIVETEAYFGEEDTACHAHRGRTPRTDVMYAPGGVAYVYLCYGMHAMLNVVTGPVGHPEAVLVRGVEGAVGPGRLAGLSPHRPHGILRAVRLGIPVHGDGRRRDQAIANLRPPIDGGKIGIEIMKHHW